MEKLLQFCRYYKGEDDNPFEGKEPEKAMLWNYENFWVKHESSTTDIFLSKAVEDYLAAGLATFEGYDGVPATLKSVLYNRYMQWNEPGSVEDFKKWYISKYREG